MTGLFIVFEGIDGCGKTTQLAHLAHYLKQQDLPYSGITLTREPGGTPLGENLRETLLSTPDITPEAELLLFAAVRAQHVATVIKPALEAGHLVLCDRFTHSTIAYQAGGRGLDRHKVNQSIDLATNGLEPDLTIWIDTPPIVAEARLKGKDSFELEAFDFHERVHDEYARLHHMDPSMIKVKGWESVEEVATAIRLLLIGFINEKEPDDGPLTLSEAVAISSAAPDGLKTAALSFLLSDMTENEKPNAY